MTGHNRLMGKPQLFKENEPAHGARRTAQGKNLDDQRSFCPEPCALDRIPCSNILMAIRRK